MARSGIRNVLGRHARLIVVAAGITLVAAPVRVLAQPTTYAAECKVVIKAIGPGGSSVVSDVPNSMERPATFQTPVDVIESPDMAARVAKKLEVPVERVLGHIDARLIVGTEIIALQAVDEEPTFAGTLCNSYATAFLETRLENARSTLQTVHEAKRSMLTDLAGKLAGVHRRIAESASRDEAAALRLQAAGLESKRRLLEQGIVEIEAALSVGLPGSGEVISPAGSAGTPVGPNDAFPIGLMAAGIVALGVTGLMPRRRTGEV